MPNVIFHFPLKLDTNAKSASGIRPLKIINGFREAGYDVEIVSGYSTERKKKIEDVKRKIRNGIKFEVCYSESSTMPTALTDKNHLPKHPFMDFNFFKFCKKNKIPVKLFYRDVYWKFDEYYKAVKFPFSFVARFFYKYDLHQYKKYLDTLFLPSIEMLKYLPELKTLHCESLPSGCEIVCGSDNDMQDGILHLLYVGGIGSHYNMEILFRAVSKNEKVILTVCCREDEWNTVKEKYVLSENIEIVHKSGTELKYLYSKANLALIFMEDSIYRKFAVPFKLFEYMGYGKPIIASDGTWVGNFIHDNNIGWTVSYDETALDVLLDRLCENPSEILEKKENIRKCAENNTWDKRAIQINGGGGLNSQLRMLYIGGIGNQYSMEKLFIAVANTPNVMLTVCVRENDWNKVKDKYMVSDNIKIVFKSGEELNELYDEANITLFFADNDNVYNSFAVPFKLFEYVAHGKPIIASDGTWTGKFVREKNIGWSVPYDVDSLKMLLNKLHENPFEITVKTANAIFFASSNTWKDRALHIILN